MHPSAYKFNILPKRHFNQYPLKPSKIHTSISNQQASRRLEHHEIYASRALREKTNVRNPTNTTIMQSQMAEANKLSPPKYETSIKNASKSFQKKTKNPMALRPPIYCRTTFQVLFHHQLPLLNTPLAQPKMSSIKGQNRMRMISIDQDLKALRLKSHFRQLFLLSVYLSLHRNTLRQGTSMS